MSKRLHKNVYEYYLHLASQAPHRSKASRRGPAKEKTIILVKIGGNINAERFVYRIELNERLLWLNNTRTRGSRAHGLINI